MLINYIQQKRPNYDNIREILSESAVINCYANNGPVKQKLEIFLHKKLSLPPEKRVLCVNNGTAALHLILLFFQEIFDKKNNEGTGLGLKLNFLTPSFNFPCTLTNTSFCNIDVCDIDPTTNTIPLDGSKKVNNFLADYDGFIITNLFGTVVNIDSWVNYCNKNNKILIFDNASSPLTIYKKKNICEYGDFSFGSLHHTKYLGFGEGGFIVLPTDLYEKMNAKAGFGFQGTRQYNAFSSNFKMSDVAAAFILDHIESYNIKNHKRIQKELVNGLSELKDRISIINSNIDSNIVLGNLPVVFDKNVDNCFFKDIGIEANKYYYPLSKLHTNTNSLYNRIVNFPLNADLNDYQVKLILGGIKSFLSKNK